MTQNPSRKDLSNIGSLGLWLSIIIIEILNASVPQSQSFNDHTSRQKCKSGHVHPNADIPTGTWQQVEKEALMESLQKIVQAPEDRFHDSSHSVQVMFTSSCLFSEFMNTFNGNSFDAKPMKQSVIATRYSTSCLFHRHLNKSFEGSPITIPGFRIRRIFGTLK